MNSVVLFGRLAKEPELVWSKGADDKCHTNITIAVDRGYGDRKETDFIQCVAFNKTAQTICNYLSKGQQVCISGSIKTGSYKKKDTNETVYTTSVMVDKVDFVYGQQKKAEQDTISEADAVVNEVEMSAFENVVPDAFQMAVDDIPF